MNPFLKSFLSVAVGGIAVAADGALSSIVPSGGFAHTLQTMPALGVAFSFGLMSMHNFLTGVEVKLGIHPTQS